MGASGAPEYVCFGLKTYVPTGSGTGTVTVFGGQEDFGALVECPYGLTDLSLGATAPLTGFGTAIAVADVQGTELPDMLMGAPLAGLGNGAVQITRSRPVNGFESSLTGIYEAFDSAGNPVEARLINIRGAEMRLLLLDPLYIEWVDPSTGALCTEFGFPGFIEGQELLPDVPIATTAPHVEQVILTSDDGTNRLRVTLEYVLLSSGEVQVDIQSVEVELAGVWTPVLSGCTIPGNPFIFGKVEDAFCE